MNLLSKPYKITFNLIGSYLSQLYMNPVPTKSITSCVIAGLGNFISQQMSGAKLMNHDMFWAFVIFGLLFGGSVPHYFQKTVEGFLSENSTTSLLLIERLVFMPAFTLFSWYLLLRLVGSGHLKSCSSAFLNFPSLCKANLKYLSLLQYINIFFVPPILRAIFSNLIDFFWVMYLSHRLQEEL